MDRRSRKEEESLNTPEKIFRNARTISAEEMFDFDKKHFPGNEVFEAGSQENGIEDFNHETHVLLSYGSKELVISFDDSQEVIAAGGALITNTEAQKEEGETTALYSAGKKIMERHGAKNKKTVEYTLVTEEETIKAWVNSKGNDLFSWDSVNDDYGNSIKAIKKLELKT